MNVSIWSYSWRLRSWIYLVCFGTSIFQVVRSRAMLVAVGVRSVKPADGPNDTGTTRSASLLAVPWWWIAGFGSQQEIESVWTRDENMSKTYLYRRNVKQPIYFPESIPPFIWILLMILYHKMFGIHRSQPLNSGENENEVPASEVAPETVRWRNETKRVAAVNGFLADRLLYIAA